VREAGNARGRRQTSGAVHRFSNKNARNLLGNDPLGLRLRASLRVSLPKSTDPGMPGECLGLR